MIPPDESHNEFRVEFIKFISLLDILHRRASSLLHKRQNEAAEWRIKKNDLHVNSESGYNIGIKENYAKTQLDYIQRHGADLKASNLNILTGCRGGKFPYKQPLDG